MISALALEFNMCVHFITSWALFTFHDFSLVIMASFTHNTIGGQTKSLGSLTFLILMVAFIKALFFNRHYLLPSFCRIQPTHHWWMFQLLPLPLNCPGLICHFLLGFAKEGIINFNGPGQFVKRISISHGSSNFLQHSSDLFQASWEERVRKNLSC